MDIDNIMKKCNPWILRLLKSRFHGLISGGLMVLHIQGVRSGIQYKIPVGYQRQDNLLVVLVSKARRKNWWRNYRLETPLSVTLAGVNQAGLGALVDKESAEFKSLVAKTFKRLPSLSKQFGFSLASTGVISNEEWDIVKLDAELVIIKLSAVNGLAGFSDVRSQ